MLVILSPTNPKHSDLEAVNELFRLGLQFFILRIPQGDDTQYIDALKVIDRQYHNRVIVPWGVREISLDHRIAGFYLKAQEALSLSTDEIDYLEDTYKTIVGCHSIEEVREIDEKFVVSLFLLSPLFDSISKKGYQANPLLSHIPKEITSVHRPVLAMGGITPENYLSVFDMGYSGAAVIGSIWDGEGTIVENYEKFPKPTILSIAGHDPSGGAGIDADRETAKYFGVKCYTVVTGTTIQDDNLFEEFVPLPDEKVLKGVRFILARHPEIRYAKIGMISSMSLLLKLIHLLKSAAIGTILWDPIVVASKGSKALYSPSDRKQMLKCLDQGIIITPNSSEYKFWFENTEIPESNSIIVLKGVVTDGKMYDQIIVNGEVQYATETIMGGKDRHGTGCRYSTALLCSMILDGTLPNCMNVARDYVHAYRLSYPNSLTFDPNEFKSERIRHCIKLQYITHKYSKKTIEKVLKGGCKWIQLRLKTSSTEERIQKLHEVRPLCDQYGAVLIIDDDIEAAKEGQADGVHLGQLDTDLILARRYLGESFIIGYTVNDENMLIKAYSRGADYVGIGPYRHTSTKANLSPILGREGINNIVGYNLMELPLILPTVAIGGITLNDLPEICSTGVTGVAISGDIEKAKNVTEHVCKLIKVWEDNYEY